MVTDCEEVNVPPLGVNVGAGGAGIAKETGAVPKRSKIAKNSARTLFLIALTSYCFKVWLHHVVIMMEPYKFTVQK
jgi:hypothetical protein